MKLNKHKFPPFTSKRAVQLFCFILLFISLCVSCATRDKVMKAKNTEGKAVVYPISEKTAWELTKTVFKWNKAGTIKEYPEQKFLYSETKGIEWDSW